MLIAVTAGFIAAILVPVIHRFLPKISGFLLMLVPGGILVYLISFFDAITSGEKISFNYQWVPELSISLNFYLDGLSLFFAILISFFGVLIILYSGKYLEAHHHQGRFYIYLLAFMASMLGIVLAGNLITLFLFWELTSVTSFLLIGFSHEDEGSRKSALQALIITAAGGMALLAGFIIMGQAAGSLNVEEILNSKDKMWQHPLMLPLMILLLIGAFTKSAQFPFHFWLPNAMAAPTPVSAYLHSATMVKAGVYLVARFTPLFGDNAFWQWSLVSVGFITLLLGALMAFMQKDLKKILAYTTVSALGILFLMLGINTSTAIKAIMVFLFAHALYKGALFLVAGILDKKTGTRDINSLSGLGKKMPLTAIATILACLSMAGIIPMIGFLGKELLYESALGSSFPVVFTTAIFISGLLFAAISFELGYTMFFGARKETPKVPQEAPAGMLIAPITMSLITVFSGVLPFIFTLPMLKSASGALSTGTIHMDLKLWHGFNEILLLSTITIAAGFICFFFREKIRRKSMVLNQLEHLGPEGICHRTFSFMIYIAKKFTVFLQNGILRNYIAVIILVFIAIAGYILVLNIGNDTFQGLAIKDVRLYEIIFTLFLIVAIAVFLTTRITLVAIIGMGLVGYGVAVFFYMFGAPDVAITQFLIETLTVVLFVLILHKLPRFRKFGSGWKQVFFKVVSVAFGLFMTTVLLIVTNQPLSSKLKEFFTENSFVLGKGRNIVNVILVDFRALDTLGEITVLCIAAMGIFALLKLKLDQTEK